MMLNDVKWYPPKFNSRLGFIFIQGADKQGDVRRWCPPVIIWIIIPLSSSIYHQQKPGLVNLDLCSPQLNAISNWGTLYLRSDVHETSTIWLSIYIYILYNQQESGWATPLKNMNVNWDD